MNFPLLFFFFFFFFFFLIRPYKMAWRGDNHHFKLPFPLPPVLCGTRDLPRRALVPFGLPPLCPFIRIQSLGWAVESPLDELFLVLCCVYTWLFFPLPLRVQPFLTNCPLVVTFPKGSSYPPLSLLVFPSGGCAPFFFPIGLGADPTNHSSIVFNL